MLRRSIESTDGIGTKNANGWANFHLAEIYLLKGDLESAEEWLRRLHAYVQESGEAIHSSSVHRLAGEIDFARNGAEAVEAESQFQDALRIARKQEYRLIEIRAAVPLARLWQSQGKTTEARDLLAPVYGWFTEGLDTRDLIEAKALLDEL